MMIYRRKSELRNRESPDEDNGNFEKNMKSGRIAFIFKKNMV